MSTIKEIFDQSDYFVHPNPRGTGFIVPLKPDWNAGDAAYPDAPFDLTFSGGGGAYHYQSPARLLSPATADVPVLAYDAEGNVLGLAGFGVNQNLVSKSEEFDDAVWTKAGTTVVTANQFIAPDGTLTADLLEGATGTFTTNTLNRIINISSSQPYNFSLFIYLATATTCSLRLFDGSTGVSNTVTITDSGWQRIDLSRITGGATAQIRIIVEQANGSVYIWGAQVTNSNIVLPYVKTTTTAVTAPANIITGALPAEITGASAISGACIVNVPANIVGVSQFIVDITDNSSFERIGVFIQGSSNKYALLVTSGGSETALITSDTLPINQNVALSWAVTTNSAKLYMNGVLQGVEDTTVVFPTVNKIDLMRRVNALDGANGELNGYMRLTALKGEEVDDATLIDWSTL